MSYSNPERIQYTLAAVTTTDAGATIATINGPKGKSGRIAEINAYITTTHVLGTGTKTAINVGHGSGDDLTAMASWAVPAGTAPIVLSGSGTTGALKPNFRLPADTAIKVNTIQNATGSPAGVVVYSIAIDWF
jgi:hypothetical protein